MLNINIHAPTDTVLTFTHILHLCVVLYTGNIDLKIHLFSVSNYSITIQIIGNSTEFKRAVQLVIDNLDFNKPVTIQVFEATIRLVATFLVFLISLCACVKFIKYAFCFHSF